MVVDMVLRGTSLHDSAQRCSDDKLESLRQVGESWYRAVRIAPQLYD